MEKKRNFSTYFCIDYERHEKNRNSHAIIIFLLRNPTNFNLKFSYRKGKTNQSRNEGKVPLFQKIDSTFICKSILAHS